MSVRELGAKASILKVDNLTPDRIADILGDIQQQKDASTLSVIAQKVDVSSGKIDLAMAFWKPVLFGTLKEGRQLNGIEAYELGDDKNNVNPDKGPYIAMCNIMALEALRIMGDHHPTVTDAKMMAFATDREKEVCDFWHQSFAPTAFQAEWAWKAVLAVLAGDPIATRELLDSYRDQLP